MEAGNNCSHACFLESLSFQIGTVHKFYLLKVLITLEQVNTLVVKKRRILMCGSRKYLYPPQMEDSFICTPPPHPPGFQGVFDDPHSPQEFPEFSQGLRLPSFGNSKWFWYLKTKKVNTNSVTKIW